MFFPILTFLPLSIFNSVAGTPSNALASAKVARAKPHLPKPKLKLKFVANVAVDLTNLSEVRVPEGIRINGGITG